MTSSRRGMEALPPGAVEPAAHHRYRLLVVADPGIKPGRFGIGIADHQLDLAYPALLQPRFGGAHQPAPETKAPMRRGDREIIDPAAMPVMADHDAADDAVLLGRHQDLAVARTAQQRDIGGRRVPRPG